MAVIKTGQETLSIGGSIIPFSLLDFWRWNSSDLLSNATRGRFAEFIVATAAGVNLELPREEWATYDLTTPEGIKIEVKSSALLQSWAQSKASIIRFGIQSAKAWDPLAGLYNPIAQRHADVYVFCFLNHLDKNTINPLNLDQWEFYVISTEMLNHHAKNQLTISLKALKSITQPCNYSLLKQEIINKRPKKV